MNTKRKNNSKSSEKIMTENQYLKMLRNMTEEPLRKSKEEGEKDHYDYVLENGFRDFVEYPVEYKLFDGLTSNGFCPCGSKMKFKHCCEQKAEVLVESVLKAKYVGFLETTKNPEKLPISFRISPVFELEVAVTEQDTHLLKEIIRTHPTVVDHLYLISAKNLAQASAESPYARYHYDLMVSFEEDTPFNFKKGMKADIPLHDAEKERYVYGKTAVPSSRHMMRKKSVKILSAHSFVLQ
jgi:hypothetical protein